MVSEPAFEGRGSGSNPETIIRDYLAKYSMLIALYERYISRKHSKVRSISLVVSALAGDGGGLGSIPGSDLKKIKRPISASRWWCGVMRRSGQLLVGNR